MRYFILSAFAVLVCSLAPAQNTFNVVVVDGTSREQLIGAVVAMQNTTNGAATNIEGTAVIKDIPNGKTTFVISLVGYKKQLLSVEFPLVKPDSIYTVLLETENETLGEVTISTTRTNSRIDDLPIKVEVLGEDDMNEEATLVPSGIGSILGDLSIITIQKTNPVNGNDAVRMQGLDYKYTQLLRDGLPLYEGFSGSLGVLSIPPLDLKQVEIIKGSASTLYGGGAIGGLINFISKTPTDTPSVTLLLNVTSLKETDFNTFLSKRNNKIGATLFAGATIKQAFDVNKDGFAEVPEQKHFIFHPRMFLYLRDNLNADIGLTISSDNRRGGDMQALRYKPDTLHTFLFEEKVLRGTVDGHITWQINNKSSLTAKVTGSVFNRNLTYSGFNFSGQQLSSYSEVNYLYKYNKHTFVAGTNFITELFQKRTSDPVSFNNYNYNTLGVFAQEDWQVLKKLAIEAGIRADYHNRYHLFVLPRIGIFLRPSDNLSIRLHYGSGYKTPNLFTTSQPTDYMRLVPITNNIKAEFSNGVNMDINYHFTMFDKLTVQLNQAFYYTDISNPTNLQTDSLGNNFIGNAPFTVRSIGTDTYLRLSISTWELYLGYNHTEAKQRYTGFNYNMPFNPKDKFAITLAYAIEGKWRMGVEAAYTANQYITNNQRVPNFWFFAAMVERKFKFGSLVLNCENLGDYRQSRYQSLYTGTVKMPVFRNIWGPVEGRVFNLSLKISI